LERKTTSRREGLSAIAEFLVYAYSGWTPESASHNRSHVSSPWCFAAAQNDISWFM